MPRRNWKASKDALSPPFRPGSALRRATIGETHQPRSRSKHHGPHEGISKAGRGAFHNPKLERLIRQHKKRERRTVTVQRSADGTPFLVNADGIPLSGPNYYLRVRCLRRDSIKTLMRIAYGLARYYSIVNQCQPDPDNPTESFIQDYLKLIHCDNANAAYSQEVATLADYFRHLHGQGVTRVIPFSFRKSRSPYSPGSDVPDILARVPHKLLILPSREDFQAFYEKLSPSRRRIARLLISTGARISEFLALAAKWSRRQRLPTGMFTIVVQVKGGGTGQLFFDPELEREIDATLENRGHFVDDRGNRDTRQTIARDFLAARRAAKLACKITPHTLRHAFASALLPALKAACKEQGLDPILALQYLMNHASPLTTIGLYVHPFAIRKNAGSQRARGPALFSKAAAARLLASLPATARRSV